MFVIGINIITRVVIKWTTCNKFHFMLTPPHIDLFLVQSMESEAVAGIQRQRQRQSIYEYELANI